MINSIYRIPINYPNLNLYSIHHAVRKDENKSVKFACITRVCPDVRTLFGKSKRNVINAEEQSTKMMNTGQTPGDTYTAPKNVQSEQTELNNEIHTMTKNSNQITKTVKVQINTIDRVKAFVETACSIESDLDIVSGRYVIDAKSIMGIFSLDITNPLTLKIYANNEETVNEILEKMKGFLT